MLTPPSGGVYMRLSSCLGIAGGGLAIAFVVFIGAAMTIGGYSLDDQEIDEARLAIQDFKAENPELARQFGRQCAQEIGRSPWHRDGALALFRCIRAKADAAGY